MDQEWDSNPGVGGRGGNSRVGRSGKQGQCASEGNNTAFEGRPGQDFVEGQSVGDVDSTDPGSAQLTKVGADAKGLADVMGQGADVGAFGALDAETRVGELIIEEFEPVDVDQLGRAFDGL